MAWVRIPDLGVGLNLDGQPEELPPGTSTAGSNMRYRAGYAEKFGGMATVYTTPPVAPYHIVHYTVGGTRYVVWAGLQKTYADDGTTLTDITNANNTGAIDDRYTGGIFNGVYIQNNGVNVPQFWGGNTASNLANLTAWPAGHTCGFLRPFKNYLVAGDITRGGVRERGTVLWSHLADPGAIPDSWDIADATKDAGDVSLSETNGTLIDCLPLGDMNILYKDDAIHFQQSIQSTAIFRFGRLPGDTGLLARGCVVNTPMGHVYLTPGFDVVIHNGQGPQSILEGTMRTWLRNSINATYAARSFLCINSVTNELLVCFPSGANVACDMALVWNWKDNTFARRVLSNVTYGSLGQVTLPDPDSWESSTDTWSTIPGTWGTSDYAPNMPRLILARTTPDFSMFDASSKDSGVSFDSLIECSGMHFGSPMQRKLCRGARFGLEGAPGVVVYVQLGAADLPDQSPTWQAAVPYTIGTDIEVHSFASGRFLALRLYSTDYFRVKSGDLDVVPQGMY
jgi:hypothetical protein